jgi:hypothetical protein
MTKAAPALPDLEALRSAGAAKVDAVGWHYVETLARRTQAHSGPAQRLLQVRLKEALRCFEVRMNGASESHAVTAPDPILPSPLAKLLQDMRPKNAVQASGAAQAWPNENPRIQQFRQQLSQLSVQKQVTQAISQAPQNAGPINSHMLVLRSLGLMRDLSPDYLNRFMAHLDTLLCLDEADKGKLTVKKALISAQARP